MNLRKICQLAQFWILAALLPSLALGQDPATARANTFVRMSDQFYAARQFDSSVSYLWKAAEIFEGAGAWREHLRCLNSIGDRLIDAGKYQDALGVLRRAEETGRCRLNGEDPECAATLQLLGYEYTYLLEQADTAVAYCRQAVAIGEKTLGPNHPRVASFYHTLGIALVKKGEYDEALRSLRTSIRIRSLRCADGDPAFVGSYLAISSILTDRAEYDSAMTYLEKTRSILESTGQGNSFLAASCSYYLSTVDLGRGDNARAIAEAKKALEISRRYYGETHGAVIGAMGRLGELYAADGDYDRAIEMLEQSAAGTMKVEGPVNSGLAWCYRKLSSAYAEKGETKKAMEYAEKALALQKKTLGPKHPAVAGSLEAAGKIYRDLGEFAKALDYFRQSIALRESFGTKDARPDIAGLTVDVGDLYVRMGKRKDARAALQRALTIEEKAGQPNRTLLAEIHRRLGDLASAENDLPAALREHDWAIATLLPALPDSAQAWNLPAAAGIDGRELARDLQARGVTLQRLFHERTHDRKDLEAALAAFEAASSLSDRLRRSFVTDGSKLLVQTGTLESNERALETCLTLYDLTWDQRYISSAFRFAERRKAALLLDGIHDATAKRFAGIPDSLLETERQLRKIIANCERQLVKSEGAGVPATAVARAALQETLRSARSRYRDLLDSYERSYPAYYALRFEDPTAPLAKVRQALDAESCLLEYVIGDRSLFLFAITKDSCTASRVPLPRNLHALTRTLRSSIRTIEPADYVSCATALYDIIIRPIRQRIAGRDHLIIVPDGPLYYVPFEALLPGGRRSQGAVDFTCLQYLLKTHEISYAFSSTFYLGTTAGAGPAGPDAGSIAGFAPVFRDSTKGRQLLASRGAELTESIAGVRSITVDGMHFNELPYSGTEVVSIVRDFESNGRQGVAYVNGDATEAAFKRDAPHHAYLHIATHGYINEDHPDLSALLFAQPEDSTSAEDGVLYAGETYDLKLNADLVVLSSCESGVGKLVKGEGIMAMTRGFFYAGARNMVFSLWKVYDDETNTLMVNFYRDLLSGSRYSSALRNAKLSLIQNPRTAFPSKWAGFVLMGR